MRLYITYTGMILLYKLGQLGAVHVRSVLFISDISR